MLPEISQNEIENYCKLHSINGFLQGFFSPKMIAYLRKRFGKDSELIASIKRLDFTFKDFYDFEFSQVSVGGVKFSNLKPSLESKFEPGYLKSVFIDGKHVLDEYKKFSLNVVKGQNPRARIEPKVDYEFDREQVDWYGA